MKTKRRKKINKCKRYFETEVHKPEQSNIISLTDD